MLCRPARKFQRKLLALAAVFLGSTGDQICGGIANKGLTALTKKFMNIYSIN